MPSNLRLGHELRSDAEPGMVNVVWDAFPSSYEGHIIVSGGGGRSSFVVRLSDAEALTLAKTIHDTVLEERRLGS